MALTKEKTGTEIKAVNEEADVHHMVRKIGTQAMPDGTITADMADAQVRNWLQAGYKLTFTHALGIEPNGINILYIFTKNA